MCQWGASCIRDRGCQGDTVCAIGNNLSLISRKRNRGARFALRGGASVFPARRDDEQQEQCYNSIKNLFCHLTSPSIQEIRDTSRISLLRQTFLGSQSWYGPFSTKNKKAAHRHPAGKAAFITYAVSLHTPSFFPCNKIVFNLLPQFLPVKGFTINNDVN
jgi:hypothetical protein